MSASGIPAFGQALACAGVSAVGEITNQTVSMAKQGNWSISGYDVGKIAKEGLKGGGYSLIGSAGGHLIGKYSTKTIPKAEAAF